MPKQVRHDTRRHFMAFPEIFLTAEEGVKKSKFAEIWTAIERMGRLEKL
jgi:hypothetical protein